MTIFLKGECKQKKEHEVVSLMEEVNTIYDSTLEPFAVLDGNSGKYFAGFVQVSPRTYFVLEKQRGDIRIGHLDAIANIMFKLGYEKFTVLKNQADFFDYTQT